MCKNIVLYQILTTVTLMTSITIPSLASDYLSNNDEVATRSTSNTPPILENPSVADIKLALGIGSKTRSVISAAPSARSGFGSIIEFDSNSTTVVPSTELKTIAAALKDLNSSDSILIEGHTDSKGKASRNKKLSLKRANAVRQWLEKNGVPGGVVKTQGAGEDKPIDDNNTEEGRRRNRRVEFTRID